MCSHYTALKKREQMEKYFRSRGLPVPRRNGKCGRASWRIRAAAA